METKVLTSVVLLVPPVPRMSAEARPPDGGRTWIVIGIGIVVTIDGYTVPYGSMSSARLGVYVEKRKEHYCVHCAARINRVMQHASMHHSVCVFFPVVRLGAVSAGALCRALVSLRLGN